MTTTDEWEFSVRSSPNGSEFAYILDDGFSWRIAIQRMTENSEREIVNTEGVFVSALGSFSPDGSLLAFAGFSSGTSDLWLSSRVGSDVPEAWLETEAEEEDPQISPDGRWLAFVSNELGARRVWIAPFNDSSERRPIRLEGAGMLRWSRDGGKLFFQRGSSVFFVSLSEEALDGLQPEFLVDGVYVGSDQNTWVVGPDDDSIIAIEPKPEPRLYLVEQWVEEVKRKLPSD